MKKHFMIYTYTALLLSLVSVVNIKASVILPPVFADHMVLQQKSNVSLWGEADNKTTVIVNTSWNNEEYTTKSDAEGKWRIKVKTPEAGDPYSISISDGETITINDILIGEVWFCSGQSNMEETMKGYYNQYIKGGNDAIAESRNSNIRLFTIERNRQLKPQHSFKGQWKECNPENVGDFSAVAYFFGRRLQKLLGVPIGLISSSWGGQWMSKESLSKFNWADIPDGNDGKKHSFNTFLYNGMINPLLGYNIKGVIWYQGEANAKHPKEYEQLLSEMISSWREAWGIGDFPFYLFQIAPYDYKKINSAWLRDAQRKVALKTKNTGMVSLMDIGEEHNIHPVKKRVVGERMALMAMVKSYGLKGVECSGPVLKDMTVEGDVVKLTFDHAEHGFTTYGKELVHFTIAGENKHFYPAKAQRTRGNIMLWSPFVKKPVAVRYAFDDFVVGELFNTEGLPASSFRTDDWEIEEY